MKKIKKLLSVILCSTAFSPLTFAMKNISPLYINNDSYCNLSEILNAEHKNDNKKNKINEHSFECPPIKISNTPTITQTIPKNLKFFPYISSTKNNDNTYIKKTHQRQKNLEYHNKMEEVKRYQICFLAYVFMLVNPDKPSEIRLHSDISNFRSDHGNGVFNLAFTHICNNKNEELLRSDITENARRNLEQPKLFNNRLFEELLGKINENYLNEAKKAAKAGKITLKMKGDIYNCTGLLKRFINKELKFNELEGFTFNYMDKTYTYSKKEIFDIGNYIYAKFVYPQLKVDRDNPKKSEYIRNGYVKLQLDEPTLKLFKIDPSTRAIPLNQSMRSFVIDKYNSSLPNNNNFANHTTTGNSQLKDTMNESSIYSKKDDLYDK